MRVEAQEAVGLTTAPNYKRQRESYRPGAPESTVKLQIGEFLLYLCSKRRRSGSAWRQLEAELRAVLL